MEIPIPSGLPGAIAYITGGETAGGLHGVVKFYSMNGRVLVVADVQGLPQSRSGGFFALHIHEGTACTGEAFADTGSHYNPGQLPHPRHAGDLPPLLSCSGSAYMAVLTDRFRIRDVLGRTVVIHSDADDFRTQPAGNAGAKIACGVIQRAVPMTQRQPATY